MKRDKKTPSPKSATKRVRAAAGHNLPLFYQGSIIHIDDVNAVDIDVTELEYEPKIQFERALADQHIIEESK